MVRPFIRFWLTLAILSLFLPARAPAEELPTAPSSKDKKDDLRPFAEVIQDATAIPGFFTLYRGKNGELFAEILPRQFEQPFLSVITLDRGIGDALLLTGFPLNRGEIYLWRRVNRRLFLVKRNAAFTADSGRPIHEAVKQSFSDAILGTAKVEAIHPERKSLLVNLGDLLLADLPGLGARLSKMFDTAYLLDKEKSYPGTAKAFPLNVEIAMELHYAAAKPPERHLPTVADPRSLPFLIHYSFSALPESPFRPRLADTRVGHFVTALGDFSDDSRDNAIVRYVNRWRLEQGKPIVFWIEKTTPIEYRDAVRDGVLMWNRAFERIGFVNALQVKVQPDDADWDPADVRYNTIRWITSPSPSFGGMGPSRVNPMTGEILDADILIEAEMMRNVKRGYRYIVSPLSSTEDVAPGDWHHCTYGAMAGREAAIGSLAMLVREGREAPPEYVNAFLRLIIAHEVGHTLGLRHNFRASAMLPLERLHNTAITRERGVAASVMDYLPVNIAPKGTPQGDYWSPILGPYDLWAIEYAYRPIEASSPELELPELDAIARQGGKRPELTYGTDEDAYSSKALDPLTNQGDLGNDPLGFARQRLDLARELWRRLPAKVPAHGEGYHLLRQAVDAVFDLYARHLGNAAKYVGGVYHRRVRGGDVPGVLPFQPVPRAKQREALEILDRYLFREEAFQFPPTLLNALAPEQFPDQFRSFEEVMSDQIDYPLHQRILLLQRSILSKLLSPSTLARIRENERRTGGGDLLPLPDLFRFLTDRIWGEVTAFPRALPGSFRRALQREHVKQLAKLAIAPPDGIPEDARALAREELIRLRGLLDGALSVASPRAGGSALHYARAHYRESRALADEALHARLVRELDPPAAAKVPRRYDR